MKFILLFFCLYTPTRELDAIVPRHDQVLGSESQSQIWSAIENPAEMEIVSITEPVINDFSQKTDFNSCPIGFFPGCGSELVRQLYELGITVKSYQDLKAALEEIDVLIGEVF